MEKRDKVIFYYLFAAIAAVVLFGMFVPVMEVDAAQYASISKQMWQEGSFLEIMHRSLNYLDKPPLLFWLSGFSMGIFGFNDAAYKLPSVLFSILGVWSTFRFARHYYGEKAGYWAALMYACNVAFFIFNNDIRTDTLLINLLIFSVYQLVRFREDGGWKPFVLAFLGIGLSMLAKGPLGLVFPVLAIGSDILLKRDWKFLFRPVWLLGLLIVAILLLPMCIGLYTQFDANPDAWVNGEHNVSGLRFYFWTQSFGRLTGDSIWATAYSNDPDTFYLTGTFLWAFLPWTPLFLFGFIQNTVRLFRQRFKAGPNEEWISYFAFILPLLALSKSGYQLNHYIYVVIPFTSVLAAKVLVQWEGRKTVWNTAWRAFALIFLLAVLVLLAWILIGIFPSHWSFTLLCLLPLLLLLVKRPGRVSLALAATVLLCFGVMNTYFYPELLTYQRGEHVSRLYDERKSEKTRLYYYRIGVSHSLDFYQDTWVASLGYENTDSLKDMEHIYLYTDKPGLDTLSSEKIEFEVVDSMEYFPVTQLNFGFLNRQTRREFSQPRYFIELKNTQ